MVTPYFFGLPVFTNYDFFFWLGIWVIVFKIFFGYKCRSADSIRKSVLALRDVLVALEFPEYSPSIIPSWSEESSYVIPAYTVNWLLVIVEFSQLPDRLQFLIIKEPLHGLEVRQKVFRHGDSLLDFALNARLIL